jgi:hypothetical protein
MIVIVTGEKQHNKDEYTESSPLHAPGKEHMASPAETVTPVIQKQVPVRADVMPFFFVRVILAQGHVNLLCIVSILSDVSEETYAISNLYVSGSVSPSRS